MPCTGLMLSPTVLKLSAIVLNSLHGAEGIPESTEAIPHMYCSYPPTVLKVSFHSADVISPHVLMLFPTALNNLPSAEAISHSTEAIPHSTYVPPMY